MRVEGGGIRVINIWKGRLPHAAMPALSAHPPSTGRHAALGPPKPLQALTVRAASMLCSERWQAARRSHTSGVLTSGCSASALQTKTAVNMQPGTQT